MPQAKKKPKSIAKEGNPIAQRLGETAFILTILLAIYLLACLLTYAPADPGPFNKVASDQVQNAGRVLGAWLANVLLFLTGYLAYAFPLVLAYSGWLIYSREVKAPEVPAWPEWLARLTGFLLFVLSATGLAHLHSAPICWSDLAASRHPWSI